MLEPTKKTSEIQNRTTLSHFLALSRFPKLKQLVLFLEKGTDNSNFWTRNPQKNHINLEYFRCFASRTEKQYTAKEINYREQLCSKKRTYQLQAREISFTRKLRVSCLGFLTVVFIYCRRCGIRKWNMGEPDWQDRRHIRTTVKSQRSLQHHASR